MEKLAKKELSFASIPQKKNKQIDYLLCILCQDPDSEPLHKLKTKAAERLRETLQDSSECYDLLKYEVSEPGFLLKNPTWHGACRRKFMKSKSQTSVIGDGNVCNLRRKKNSKFASLLKPDDPFSDAFFLCGAERACVKAHRSILVTYSSLFQHVLEGEEAGEASTIYLPDYRPEEIFNLISFLYNGSVCVSQEDAAILQDILNDFCISLRLENLFLPGVLTNDGFVYSKTVGEKSESIERFPEFSSVLSSDLEIDRENEEMFGQPGLFLDQSDFLGGEFDEPKLKKRKSGSEGLSRDDRFEVNPAEDFLLNLNGLAGFSSEDDEYGAEQGATSEPDDAVFFNVTDSIVDVKPSRPKKKVVSRKIVSLHVLGQRRQLMDRKRPLGPRPSMIECAACHKMFRSKTTYDIHATFHVGCGLDLFFCDYCDEKFQEKEERNVHEMSSHEPLVMRSCVECKALVYNRKLNYHMNSHRLNHVTLMCHVCGEEIKLSQKLKHMRRHEKKENNNLVCDVCGKIYLRLDSLKTHKLMYHTTDGHKCYRCKLVFETEGDLEDHVLTHKTKLKALEICTLCQHEVFSSEYEEHLKDHASEEVSNSGYGLLCCPICQRNFTDEAHTANHMLFHYDSERQFECDLCFHVAKSVEIIRVHQKVVHELSKATEKMALVKRNKLKLPSIDRLTKEQWKAKPKKMEDDCSETGWMCSTCGMLFGTSEECQLHISSEHSG